MGRVFVVGVGMTKFEKPGARSGDYPDFAKEAIIKALDDAKVNMNVVEKAVCGFVYGDSTCGQRCVYEVGMTGIPIVNVNNNCSTGATALYLAEQFVRSGNNQCILAVGFEKMERGSLTSKFNDRTNPLDKHVGYMSELANFTAAPMAAQLFGNAGQEYMEKYGAKPEHFAKIAYKNHKHSVNNPYSQFRDEYSLEQIMKSPQVHGVLTKLQCCPTSDGAAAAIVASEQFVKQHGLESKAVEILAMEMATDLPSSFEGKSLMKIVGYDMTALAAKNAFGKANRKPSDVQVVELHDCFSANELITYEALGLCGPGQAPTLIDRGDNTYGGKYVVNPSGGLISKGHPLGATGLAQCAELCWQLRSEAGARQVPGAKLALQHNIGLGGAVVVALYQHGFQQQQQKGAAKSAAPASAGAGAVGEDSFIVSPYLKILQQAMDDDEDNLVERYRGAYGFRVKKADGKEGFWLIDARTGKGTIKFNSKEKPDVTFIVKDEDVVELITGEINPQKAFFQGKVKVQGNMGMAMKLVSLQTVAASKIAVLRSKL